MMKRQPIAIYGGGGFAREVAWLISSHEELDVYEFVGYIDDAAERMSSLNGKPVYSFGDFARQNPESLVAVAIGKPATRRAVAEKCIEAGFSFATLWHHSVDKSEFVQAGEGSIVCCGTILTVNIQLGKHVHINLDCTVGHDVTIGDYSTLAPGVHVSGNVAIGKDVYIGTGANIINGEPSKPLVIGDGCVIGAGACITADAEPRTLYAGVPAKAKKHYA